MKPIEKIALICNEDRNKFYLDIHELIGKYQSDGLEIEIQYQHSPNMYSAFIIGRL